MSKARREEIDNTSKRTLYLNKFQVQSPLFEEPELDSLKEPCMYYGLDLPF